jgi:hypothetical protein
MKQMQRPAKTGDKTWRGYARKRVTLSFLVALLFEVIGMKGYVGGLGAIGV